MGVPVVATISNIVLFFGGDCLGLFVGTRVTTEVNEIVSLLGHQSGCIIVGGIENVSVGRMYAPVRGTDQGSSVELHITNCDGILVGNI